MAVTIGSFAHQRVTIDTEMALDINITGNPDKAYIEGLLEGYYTNWNDPTLKVRGRATRLINNVPFTVIAQKGRDRPVTRKGMFSVVPAAPVISSLPRQTIYKDFDNEIIVPISNNPAKVSAESRWSGLKYERHSQGIRIFGSVPKDAVLTFDEGTIDVYAETGELRDEQDFEFEFSTATIAYIIMRVIEERKTIHKVFLVAIDTDNNSINILKRFYFPGGFAARSTGFDGIAYKDGLIYVIENVSQANADKCYRFAEVENEQAVSNYLVYYLPWGNDWPSTLDILGDNLYIPDVHDRNVREILADTTGNEPGETIRNRATTISTASLGPSGFNVYPGFCMDGNDAYLANFVSNNLIRVRVRKPLTTNREYSFRIDTLPNTGFHSRYVRCKVVGNDIYVAAHGYLWIANKNTAEGQTVSPRITLTLPSEMGLNVRGFAIRD